MKDMTDRQLLQRVWDKEEIKKLISRRAYYLADHRHREELEELWVSDEPWLSEASFGGNWGYYLGMDEIRRWYVLEYEERLLAESASKKPGDGVSVFHPMSSPLIRLAGDGQSARALFYSIGEETYLSDSGPVAYWINEKIAVDVLKINGAWKILHLVESCDFCHPVGEPFDKQILFPAPEQDIMRRRFGTPTISMTVHDPMFNWEDDYPYIPGDYEHFGDNGSYGPWDHPNYGKQVCAVWK